MPHVMTEEEIMGRLNFPDAEWDALSDWARTTIVEIAKEREKLLTSVKELSNAGRLCIRNAETAAQYCEPNAPIKMQTTLLNAPNWPGVAAMRQLLGDE